MAKVSTFKRLSKENFSEENRELIETLGFSINDFASEIINALNKNITIDDNLKMEYKDITVIVDGSGFPTKTTQYTIGLDSRIRGVLVVRAQNLDNIANFVNNAPFISYSQNNNNIITVNHITGLIANEEYRLTLLSLG